ncbi:hypothetical protein PR202_ga02157 [Eleusine coracana subsp. coracana]|uniref:EndoU domain-containing protein n=1 Tax=Eleusine coracana subsp. coracana TaxID=191504 RepID=A0AAV5BIZ4_ELECO|nr:hypothetical protein PR202_ga02157 [Eleusine coracana subsp. coracana]
MEGLVKGLEGVAIDEVERAETRRGRRAAEEDGDREERSRSTWAEVVSEEKGEDQERIWGQAEHERKQKQHVPVSTQLHSQDKEGERNGQGCDGATGTGNFRLQQQASECGREQQHSEEWKGYKRPPSEQEYSEDTSHIHHGLNVEPTREELNNLSKACSRLWELDLNRLIPGMDYTIECGEGKKVYHRGDKASENLICWLEDDVLRRPTYSRFCALLDNYNPHQGYKESVTQQDKYEEAAFIEEISRSAPIKYLHRYLVMKGVTSQEYEDFKKMLTSLWFDLCGRGGCSSSSSAFEHVFVGEIKGQRQGENEVSGFHNWIQFYLEESNGNVDYQGYIFPKRRGELPDSETQLLTIQFEWHGVLKTVSSTLIGVSPEFEIALYTLCFFAGGEDNHVEIGPYSVIIKCYRLGDDKIGSAFPIAEN